MAGVFINCIKRPLESLYKHPSTTRKAENGGYMLRDYEICAGGTDGSFAVSVVLKQQAQRFLDKSGERKKE